MYNKINSITSVVIMLTRTVALLLVWTGLASAECPNGFVHHDTSCYHFSHDLEDWANALTFCKVLGAELVEISDAAEDSFLVSQVKQKGRYFWIGGDDVGTEGDWTWVASNKRLSTSSYTHWYPGQPDNAGFNENCMFMSPLGYWFDAACKASNFYYICETPYRQGPPATAVTASASGELVG